MNKIKLLLGIALLCLAIPSLAQSRFGILGGGSLSTSSAKDSKVKPGYFVGGLYDIKVCDNFYIQPQLLFSYEENELKNTETGFYSQYGLTLPVLASFKVNLDNGLSLRFNAGPYLKYALFGHDKHTVIFSDNKESVAQGWWHQDFGDHFTYGVKAGLSLEAKHLFYFIDGKYSLKKNMLNFYGHGYTVNLGLGYKF